MNLSNASKNFESESVLSENDNFLSFVEEDVAADDVPIAPTIAVQPVQFPAARVLRDRANILITERYREINIAYCEPTTHKKAISGPEAEQWKLCIEQELLGYQKNGTWTIVPTPVNRT